MSPHWKRWLWNAAKIIAAALILFFAGKQLLGDLEKLNVDWSDSGAVLALVPQPLWFIPSALLYLLALLPSVWYWRHLHHHFGYPLDAYVSIRSHYIGQVGKYVPGKALALAMRAALTHPYGVPYGVSVIISFYEVLTSMAAGGFVAALIYVVDPPALSDQLEVAPGWQLDPQWAGLILMGLCGIPLLPGVFNFVVAKMTANIQAFELYRLPPVRYVTLLLGMLATAGGWWVQGLSMWAMLQAVLPNPPALTLSSAAQCTAAIAFANVAGFVIIVVPGGLGVREYLLKVLLSFAGPEGLIAFAAIVLRLLWILSEALLALILYFVRPKPPPEPASPAREGPVDIASIAPPTGA